MQLIKAKNRPIGKDVNIKIPLGATSSLNGLQQAINDYIERETGLSINAVTDGETYRFLYDNDLDKTFKYEFYSGGSFSTSFNYAGFTNQNILNQDDVFTNSFFILQIVDSMVSENQVLLHNSYYNGYQFGTGSTAQFDLNKTDEFMYLYIPEWFLNENPDDEVTVYAKLYFFNAKTGKLKVFYNKDNELLTTEEKMYHEVILHTNSREYSLPSGTMFMKELDNSQYTDKVNESVDSFENEKPQFPAGNLFNNDGTYTEIT